MNDREVSRVVVRVADADDSARLSLVASATFLETFAGVIAGDALVAHCEKANSKASMGALIAAGAKAWLAEIDHAPIGYALMTRPDLEAAQPGDIELKKIYLLSRFHGSGVAVRLFDAALAGAQGHRRILLGVKADNHRAIAFYSRQGFTPIGTRRFDVGGTLYDDAVMARELNQD